MMGHPYHSLIDKYIHHLLNSPTQHVMAITGRAGTGKTTLVEQILRKKGIKYIKVAHATAEGLLETCVMHPDVIILADDIDMKTLTEKKMITLLKYLVDTQRTRKIGWITLNMKKRLAKYLNENDEVEIRNKVILIMNTSLDELQRNENVRAIISRIGLMTVEVNLTKKEIIQTARAIWGNELVTAYLSVLRAIANGDDAIVGALLGEYGLRGIQQFYEIVRTAKDDEEIAMFLINFVKTSEKIRQIAKIPDVSRAKAKGIPTYVFYHYKALLEEINTVEGIQDKIAKVVETLRKVKGNLKANLKSNLKREDGEFKRQFKKQFKNGNLKTPVSVRTTSYASEKNTGGEPDEDGNCEG